MQFMRSFILFFLLIITTIVSAQSLSGDARRLLVALDNLQQSGSSEGASDNAASEVLLILAAYDDSVKADSMGFISNPELLLENAHANPLLRNLLQTMLQADSLFSTQPLDIKNNSSRTHSRERIAGFLYGGAPVSPNQYLSVERSLQDSRLPPLQNQEALRAAASNARAAQPVSALTAEALTKGLFEFVLERAQQEVAVHFIENLLDKKKAPQIDALFPNVAERYFNPKSNNGHRERYFNPQINYSQSFLEGLREAFFIDLKNLGQTLPALLFRDEYFAPLRNDPVFYGVLATYSLFGQSSQGRPLWESAPLVHRELFDRRQAADKKLNSRLAELNIDSTYEYKRVQVTAAAYMDQFGCVVDTIQNIRYAHESRISRLLRKKKEDPPNFIWSSLYDYRLLTSRKDTASLHLGLLPELLNGALDTNTLKKYKTLDWYDLFSNTSSREMRIAGLELVRRVVDGSWYNGLSHVGIFRRWQADLAAYKLKLEAWEVSGDPIELEQRFVNIKSKEENLADVIGKTHEYWMEKCGPADLQPLVQLRAIANNSQVAYIRRDSLFWLQKREEELLGLEKRIADVEKRLAKKKPDAYSASPFQQYLLRKKADDPLEKLTAEIDSLEARSNTLKVALHRLDGLHAPGEQKALNSTEPMLQATELLSNLFYVLQDSDGQGLIRPDTFETMLFDPRLRTACLGLMQQRLGRISGVGQLSPDALAGLAQLMLNDFAALPRPAAITLAGDEPDAVPQPDSIQLFQAVSTGLRALNRVLEFKLFIDPDNPQELMSLKDKHLSLQYVPEISGHCMDLLYYLEAGQHRPAGSAMVRLLASMGKQLGPPEEEGGQKRWAKKQGLAPANNPPVAVGNRGNTFVRAAEQKPENSLAPPSGSGGKDQEEKHDPKPPNSRADIPLARFLANYGDFIAGLVDARNKEEIQYLMRSLAEDPGSSRTKRTHALSVSFNTYLGVSAGNEWLARRQSDTTLRSSYFAVAPYLPVGFSLSWLMFKKKNRPQSFSLHLIGVDLGAMLTYRLEEEEALGDFKLSAKNMVRPGAQLQWNIQKTPCFVGVGWQTGAQFREENGEEFALRSNRLFLSVGLDAPVRTLFAR